MKQAHVIIAPMQAEYNRQVSHLLVEAFYSKFYPLTRLEPGGLAALFEQLLDAFPEEPASQRLVALREGEVIGTLCLKRKAGAGLLAGEDHKPVITRDERRKMFKLLTALHFLDHKPQEGECYIADLSVHPAARGKGVGKQLLHWVQHYASSDPHLNVLSLHVSGHNPGAKRLYEQISFRTQAEERSLVRFLLFHEWRWEYMVLPLQQANRVSKQEELL
ncbi:GNAT family N-acetyltransferase [Paenibacillus jilunlii]|uniref:Acetyltransferase n=1 Tax=Paenibacillus jilunlii TaxID=682956 RepID=A0A1G9UVH3_9BACL|nr:GNAT family N-acetyltransferase [Paenibacillus jilunlii]KWX78218.1 acetyltransferase [Paenibacillus jilunlii]SDM63840.1 Acetyltransferase (GNAT) family protein [Paenibacillus jilunlii]